MHVKGEFQAWDSESARLGTEIMANRLHMPLDDFISLVYTRIIQKLYNLIIEYLLDGRISPSGSDLAPDTKKLMDTAFYNPYDDIDIKISTPLPHHRNRRTRSYIFEPACRCFGTSAQLNEYSGVANAVGAVTGSIVGKEEVLIRPRYDRTGIVSYGCHGSFEYFETEDYDEALKWSKDMAAKGARDQAEAMGASNITVEVKEYNNVYKDRRIELLMETVVTARAVGNRTIVNMNV